MSESGRWSVVSARDEAVRVAATAWWTAVSGVACTPDTAVFRAQIEALAEEGLLRDSPPDDSSAEHALILVQLLATQMRTVFDTASKLGSAVAEIKPGPIADERDAALARVDQLEDALAFAIARFDAAQRLVLNSGWNSELAHRLDEAASSAREALRGGEQRG